MREVTSRHVEFHTFPVSTGHGTVTTSELTTEITDERLDRRRTDTSHTIFTETDARVKKHHRTSLTPCSTFHDITLKEYRYSHFNTRHDIVSATISTRKMSYAANTRRSYSHEGVGNDAASALASKMRMLRMFLPGCRRHEMPYTPRLAEPRQPASLHCYWRLAASRVISCLPEGRVRYGCSFSSRHSGLRRLGIAISGFTSQKYGQPVGHHYAEVIYDAASENAYASLGLLAKYRRDCIGICIADYIRCLVFTVYMPSWPNGCIPAATIQARRLMYLAASWPGCVAVSE